MKQTKLEALKTCRKLWQVEAEHGTGDKDEMFNLAGLDITAFANGCPACEYDFTHSRDGASEFCTPTCIIMWPGGGCMHYLSPFRLWRASTGDSKKYAMEIVQLCEEAIEKENQNKAETERKSKRGEYVLTNLNK